MPSPPQTSIILWRIPKGAMFWIDEVFTGDSLCLTHGRVTDYCGEKKDTRVGSVLDLRHWIWWVMPVTDIGMTPDLGTYLGLFGVQTRWHLPFISRCLKFYQKIIKYGSLSSPIAWPWNESWCSKIEFYQEPIRHAIRPRAKEFKCN